MKTNTKTIAGLGLLTAIVIVLQLLGSFIRFGPFAISLTLIPIVIGASLYGAKAGGWLGFVFGMTVLLSGDASSFLVVSVFGTIVTVLVKGTVAGLGAGAVYRLLAPKNETLAVIAAAVACPVLNTGIFLLGCLVFFLETVAGWGAGMGYESVGAYMLFGLVGLNFLFELVFNIVLSPAIVRIIHVSKN